MAKKIKYFTPDEMGKKLNSLTNGEKINTLYDALDYMQEYNGRTKSYCIFRAMGYENTYDDDENELWYKIS